MRTAIYLRISSEDADLRTGEKDESESISNQRSLLREYVSIHAELSGSEILEFCDDGWSGTNFERPAVKELLEQVKRGQINCILVKDLSRFGRDYLTVGDYISRVFPFLGVRFISVNDGFDSSNPLDIDSLDTLFRTLIYDLYSRDLSRRVKSAKRARAERGAFLSPYAPYGYVKDPVDKNHLLIDAEAADVIRRIFQMAADGTKTWEIAAVLNGDGVSSPKNYKAEAGCTRKSWRSIQEENFWTANLVAKFLRDERYIGKTVFGKRSRDIVGSTHTVKISRNDWIIVPDRHEAIVSETLFEKAQAVMREYGYIKDEADKHHLVVDPDAAEVVRLIFSMCLQGNTRRAMVHYLNDHGVPSPTAYRRLKGLPVSSKWDDPMWGDRVVQNILANPIYTGDLVQGRRRVKSYKVHQIEAVPEEEWVRVPDTHEAIIDKETFEKVQSLLKRDTRSAPRTTELHLFSGFLRCADCGKSVTRSQSGKNVYYACSTYKNRSRLACSMHSIKHERLEAAVLYAIRQQVHLAVSYSEVIAKINSAPIKKSQSFRTG